MKTTPVTEKYAGIRETGRTAYQVGSVKAFAGFPESLKKRVNLSVSFDKKSVEQIYALDLGLISENCSFTFLVAGRDFPLHATLLEGEALEEVGVFSEALNKLHNKVVLNLIGREIVFNQFIADATGSIILAATEIPKPVLSARTLAAECYKSEGLKVLPLDNILHSSQVRITRFPENQKRLQIFHREVEATNLSLENKPIKVWVKAVHLNQAYAFLNSQKRD